MPYIRANLILERCPHCSVANPNLDLEHRFESADYAGENTRVWGIYICKRCGGVVSACTRHIREEVSHYYPSPRSANDDLPERPRDYLQQAIESLHAPAGAVMLAASAVDSMLKANGLTEGSLNDRIDKAAEVGIITSGMAKWAHEVRLDANDQRHADSDSDLPTQEDASRVIEFASAVGEILFVLPNRVQRGLERASES